MQRYVGVELEGAGWLAFNPPLIPGGADPAPPASTAWDAAGPAFIGLDMAVHGLRLVAEWLDRAEAEADSPGSPDAHTVVGLVLDALGRLDASALAAVSRTIVVAEEQGCAVADGHASPTAWIAQRLRQSGPDAHRACRLAADLDALPEVLASLSDGRISRDQALAVVEAHRQQRRDQEAAERARAKAARDEEELLARAAEEAAKQASDAAAAERIRRAAEAEAARRRAEADREAAERAARAEAERRARQDDLLDAARAGGTPEDLKTRADRQRADDPDALARDEAAQRARRSVKTWRDPDTGMGRGTWWLPMPDHEVLRSLIDALRTIDPRDAEPDERRTREQADADAFTDLVHAAARAGEAPTSRGQKPHIGATVRLSTLRGEDDEPGLTRYGHRLSAATVRRLTCDSELTRLVLDADSRVLDVGRATKSWTAAQYAAAEHEQGGCVFPVADGVACGRPPGWCDLHHVRWWQRDRGRTDRDNGLLLCRRHHTMVHHDGWHLAYAHGPRIVTVTKDRADGTTCRREVRLLDHRPDGPDRPPC
jgi:hypothetical protein